MPVLPRVNLAKRDRLLDPSGASVENLRRIRAGMTLPEVEAILGRLAHDKH